MARITVEEALEKVSTRYELIILAAKRARQLATGGRRPTLEWEDDFWIICAQSLVRLHPYPFFTKSI